MFKNSKLSAVVQRPPWKLHVAPLLTTPHQRHVTPLHSWPHGKRARRLVRSISARSTEQEMRFVLGTTPAAKDAPIHPGTLLQVVSTVAALSSRRCSKTAFHAMELGAIILERQFVWTRPCATLSSSCWKIGTATRMVTLNTTRLLSGGMMTNRRLHGRRRRRLGPSAGAMTQTVINSFPDSAKVFPLLLFITSLELFVFIRFVLICIACLVDRFHIVALAGSVHTSCLLHSHFAFFPSLSLLQPLIISRSDKALLFIHSFIPLVATVLSPYIYLNLS